MTTEKTETPTPLTPAILAFIDKLVCSRGDRNKWDAYEAAKKELCRVCENEDQYIRAVRQYVLSARI